MGAIDSFCGDGILGEYLDYFILSVPLLLLLTRYVASGLVYVLTALFYSFVLAAYIWFVIVGRAFSTAYAFVLLAAFLLLVTRMIVGMMPRLRSIFNHRQLVVADFVDTPSGPVPIPRSTTQVVVRGNGYTAVGNKLVDGVKTITSAGRLFSKRTAATAYKLQ
uniref:Unglycosylated membrane protein M n=1 Tax=Equine arteritis virus (strain Bucyrus) TaxID=299386 RepID=B5LAF5_EAVBU|nr:unglycosylated membrane protein M [Equine arteritis virus]ADG39429.1 unglycosylated membrane protein M [Cloning vector pEAVrVBS/HK116 S]